MKKVGIPTNSFLSSYNVSRLFESEDRYFSQTALPSIDGQEQEEEDENIKCIRKVKFAQIRASFQKSASNITKITKSLEEKLQDGALKDVEVKMNELGEQFSKQCDEYATKFE